MSELRRFRAIGMRWRISVHFVFGLATLDDLAADPLNRVYDG